MNTYDINMHAHIERSLGLVNKEWRSEQNPEIVVSSIYDTPDDGMTSLVAYSATPKQLLYPDNSPIHQAFIAVATEEAQIDPLAVLVKHFAKTLWSQPTAMPYGFILRGHEDVLNSTGKTAYYVAPPMYFPQAFSFEQDFEPKTLFLWLVPITEKEARYVELNGASKFEAIIQRHDANMLDYQRESLI